MFGRFFALENVYSMGCPHTPGQEEQAAAMGCDKCYWKQKRKHRPVVTITLVAPEEEGEEPRPERESYPVTNLYPEMPRIPGT